MTNQELLALSEQLPYKLGTVKWIHDNLPVENQNEVSILNVTNFIRANGYGIDDLEYIVKETGSLKHFGL